MVRTREIGDGKVLEVHVSGKLGAADYKDFAPKFEQLVKEHGKIGVLFDMQDFHGWEVGSLWQDVKFDLKHFSHIDRLAMVGEKKWQKGLSTLCRPFTTAKVRYFDRDAIGEAMNWVEGEKAH